VTAHGSGLADDARGNRWWSSHRVMTTAAPTCHAELVEASHSDNAILRQAQDDTLEGSSRARILIASDTRLAP